MSQNISYSSEICNNLLPAYRCLDLSALEEVLVNLFTCLQLIPVQLHLAQLLSSLGNLRAEKVLLEELVVSISTDEIDATCAENCEHNHRNVNPFLIECLHQSAGPPSST